MSNGPRSQSGKFISPPKSVNATSQTRQQHSAQTGTSQGGSPLQNSPRPQTRPTRSGAFTGADQFEKMTGIDAAKFEAPRTMLQQRMDIANQAMDYTRSFTNSPTNVKTDSNESEQKRSVNHLTMSQNRHAIKTGDSYLQPSKDEMRSATGLQKNYSQIAGLAEITRTANCMEMSAMTLDSLGQQATKFHERANDPEKSPELRAKYQQKYDAMQDTSIQYGNEQGVKNNHMWVRMGTNGGKDTVVADAWGKGGAVPQSQYTGKDTFSSGRGSIGYSQVSLAQHSVNTEKVRKDVQAQALGQLHQHTSKSMATGKAPSQPQHKNRKSG